MHIYFTGCSKHSENFAEYCSVAIIISLNNSYNSWTPSLNTLVFYISDEYVCPHTQTLLILCIQVKIYFSSEHAQTYLSRSALFLIDLSWLMALLFSIEILAWCALISLLSLCMKNKQRGKGMESLCWTCIVSFEKDEKVPEMGGYDRYTTMCMYLMPPA